MDNATHIETVEQTHNRIQAENEARIAKANRRNYRAALSRLRTKARKVVTGDDLREMLLTLGGFGYCRYGVAYDQGEADLAEIRDIAKDERQWDIDKKHMRAEDASIFAPTRARTGAENTYHAEIAAMAR